MSSISDSIESIESKIRRLTEDYRELQSENARLKVENARLEERLLRTNQSLDDLGRRLQRQKEEFSEPDSKQSSEVLRRQIDHYIKEIDACIDWLTNQ